jgi:hypothetical protein
MDTEWREEEKFYIYLTCVNELSEKNKNRDSIVTLILNQINQQYIYLNLQMQT